MRTSTALALGGAYAAYNLGQMEPEARARFVESIVGTAADAFKRFAEDPVGGLKRLWAEKSKSPILFLAILSKLMADSLRRKRLRRAKLAELKLKEEEEAEASQAPGGAKKGKRKTPKVK
mmetsp:Transcript_36625/g.113332  ORF Transcript_36625/g.113332 Transcript_36625/m.113332 type:complete len:120 (-) Transcript_36625:23-382(-)